MTPRNEWLNMFRSYSVLADKCLQKFPTTEIASRIAIESFALLQRMFTAFGRSKKLENQIQIDCATRYMLCRVAALNNTQ